MDITLLASLVGVAGALASALFTVSYQYLQYTRQLERARLAEIELEKKKIVSDLIAYRFVLTPKGRHALPVSSFNAALSRVPVMFSHSKQCMDIYRSLGDNFDAGKFYDLITALMDDVPLDRSYIDRHLLENIPSVAPMTGT